MAKLFLKLLNDSTKWPFWVITLILGTVMVIIPCVTVNKENNFIVHPPNTIALFAIGAVLLVVAIVAYGFLPCILRE
jgi:hypothetical protein